MSQSIARNTPGLSSPPGVSGSPGFPNPLVSRRAAPEVESPINERILELVTTLSERVQRLEAGLDRLEPRKRPATNEAVDDQEGFHSTSSVRPVKQARVTEGFSGIQSDDAIPPENDGSSGQNSSDAEAEDAATVLEFLAWGRLKDSNLTSGVRDSAGTHDSIAYPDKDIIQTTQAWGTSPSSVSGGHLIMEPLQISQIQEMLPSQAQVILLFEYHANWLLFMHCSFHVQSFRRELDQFYSNDKGVISVTSVGLQWTALLFAIICGSMTCAKSAEVVKWGFHQGQLVFKNNRNHKLNLL